MTGEEVKGQAMEALRSYVDPTAGFHASEALAPCRVLTAVEAAWLRGNLGYPVSPEVAERRRALLTPPKHPSVPADHLADVQEEMADKALGQYDSRPETREHIERVRHFLRRATTNLVQRSNNHDASKLVEPELSAFDIATPKLAGLTYGSEEYKQSLRELGPALAHHFEHNDHHPEHYETGCAGMSLMALIEMLCDWRAASERTKQRTDDPERVRTFSSGLAFNQERFDYSDELAAILLNTARELGMLDDLLDVGPPAPGEGNDLPNPEQGMVC